jgi:hypothetical protein
VRHGADASHELRTPLTSVQGLAEFSLQQGEAAAQEELIRLMTRIQQEAYGWDCWSRISCSPSWMRTGHWSGIRSICPAPRADAVQVALAVSGPMPSP